MITLYNYLTANGKYKNRENHQELTSEHIANASSLITAVNRLLEELGINMVEVSSGYRPVAVNSAIGGAKKSLHTKCLAVDLVDSDRSLIKAVVAKPELLRKYGLFVEDPASTPGWVHIDAGKRSDRPSRVFKP